MLGPPRAPKEARSLKLFTPRAISPLLILALLFGLVAPAAGAPIDTKRAQVVQIKAQIDELDNQLEMAAEDYNEAKGAYDAVTAEIRGNEAKEAELSARQAELDRNLSTRVAGMYRQGPLGAIELLLGASSFEEFAATWDLLQDMNDNDASRVAEMKRTRADLAVVREQLTAQQAEAKAQFDTMNARKQSIEGQLAERQSLLSGVEGEIAALVQAQEAAARAAAATRKVTVKPSVDYGTPTNAPRSGVVSIALSKLGSPYRWAAAGPNAFDCSGFTMWVYDQVGVSLPHSSRAQINSGQRVSRANLEPGDLVFFGRSTIHHVGIYIGNGNYVHAPNTGDVVKVSSLDARSDYAGACRP